jgi:predicted DNA binding protein
MSRDPPRSSAARLGSGVDPTSIPPNRRSSTGPGNFAIYRIGVQLPPNSLGYIATHGRPELRVELMNRMEVGEDFLMIEARVFGPGASAVFPVDEKIPFVSRVEVHPETGRSALYRIVLKRPALHEVLRRHRILTRFPIVYVDGYMRFETLAPADQVRRLVRELSREVGPSRVEAVRQGSVHPSVLGLSAPQLTTFRNALAAGYFESPRRTTVTQLARQMGRSKSTVSEQLSVIQQKLAESALRLRWDSPVPR